MTISSTQAEAAWQPLMVLSTCCLKDWPAFGWGQKASSCIQTGRRGFLHSGLTWIWWYPFRRSIFEKTVQPWQLNPACWAVGRCSALLLGWDDESPGKDASCHPPSLPCVRSGLDNGEVDCWMMPSSCCLNSAYALPHFRYPVFGTWMSFWMRKPPPVTLPSGSCRLP